MKWSVRVSSCDLSQLTNAVFLFCIFVTSLFCFVLSQPSSLFPEWREFFRLGGVTHPPSQVLFLTLRDAASASLQISQADAIVGCAVLPLAASILQDQHPHNVWLPLQPPPCKSQCTSLRRTT
jgi:hypothetical protein